MIKGRIVKAVGGKYYVNSNGEDYICLVRGVLKKNSEIMVGDFVEFVQENDVYIIEKVLTRANSLLRPMVSNIDNALIVIAPLPRPDLLLVDKLIVNCHKEFIEPILCYNKTDIEDDELIVSINKDYKGIIPIVFVSAINNEGIDELATLLHNRFTCLAGQSAVGKSSIINAITGNDLLIVGEMSRIERGRNTTRHIEIFDLGNDILVADTCGFSSLENVDMPPEELTLYYDEYMLIAGGCKFKGCTHINEPDCMIKQAVENGELSKDRYQRYRLIYQELKERWLRRYE